MEFQGGRGLRSFSTTQGREMVLGDSEAVELFLGHPPSQRSVFPHIKHLESGHVATAKTWAGEEA